MNQNSKKNPVPTMKLRSCVIPEKRVALSGTRNSDFVIPESRVGLSGTHPLISKAASAALVCLSALLLAACQTTTLPEAPSLEDLDFNEATVAELQADMETGFVTSETLVRWYLRRIEDLNTEGPELRAIIEVNPDAISTARALDAERATNGPRGPLHGIPVVLKANIDTGDKMATSAGSLALAKHHAPDDATLVAKLREAGAVILAKANLSEWANFRSRESSSGWSSLGGQTRNPYAPEHNPCGSSSGSAVAVAANFTALAVGTETDGSVVCPSGQNGVVGIKPSLGLVSRDGIIPIAHSQDTAGPMARNVRDAALLLVAMAGDDDNDPITRDAPALNPELPFQLTPAALSGKRIGVLRNYWGAGEVAEVEDIFERSIQLMKSRGATVIDNIEIDVEGAQDAELEVLLYEFKADLNAYLQASGAPVQSLGDLIAFNLANEKRVMPFFGQDLFVKAQAKGQLSEAAYLEALEASKKIVQDGINAVLEEHNLDAIIAPTNSPAWLTNHEEGDAFVLSSSSYAAVAGYPNITVPAGFVDGLPVGISFFGANFSDEQLIQIAYAFEHASRVRRAP